VDKYFNHIILCGNIKLPPKYKKWPSSHVVTINYNGHDNNVFIGLPHFIKTVNCYFPDKIKDLLEIAGYVYAADRMISRGESEQLEYQNWSRDLHFHIKVRDVKFWNSNNTKSKLSEFLRYVSGDKKIEFTFLAGAKDSGQSSLFDNELIALDEKDSSTVSLFSGGLDSLAGAIKTLHETQNNVILIGHRSSVPLVRKIQKGLAKKLSLEYPGRVKYFPFDCTLTGGNRAIEETQRTRIFLYTSIALAIAINTTQKNIHIYENGITSINFSKRNDLINSRASRTTHPQTLFLLQNFFNDVCESSVSIRHPFLFNSKSDILEIIHQYGKTDFISQTISCTKTFDRFSHRTNATHCGGCSQCIDRRMAAFAKSLEDYDSVYDCDIAKDQIANQEGKTHLISYLKFVTDLQTYDENGFLNIYSNELADIIPYIDGADEDDKIRYTYSLFNKHSLQMLIAINRIRAKEDLTKAKRDNTFFSILDSRLHLKKPIEVIIKDITRKLSIVIPKAFEHRQPSHENEINDIIKAFVSTEEIRYKREYPSIRFSFSNIIPDHFLENENLIIEAKIIRKKDARSKITNEISADLFKISNEINKLFIIFDPERRVADDVEFKEDFQKNENVFIQIIR
jgi:7-cyano-7-deazaguanine synthase in queuosine biosynthesis